VYEVTDPLTWLLPRMRKTLHDVPAGIDWR
jgi:hypothetical protein